MTKKINSKTIKLIKYYNLINYNLIYNNNAINRYKKNIFEISSDKAKELDKLKKSILSIKSCNLKNNAKNIVFSDGNPKAKIMLVGEGPGSNEDLEGLPFVGRAGELLDKMLSSINLNRKNVYITNVVNYRPPENRRPTDVEIIRYLPYLKKHIEIINPKILVLLGSTALNALIGNEKVISKIRGEWIKKKNRKLQNLSYSNLPPCFFNEATSSKKNGMDRPQDDKRQKN